MFFCRLDLSGLPAPPYIAQTVTVRDKLNPSQTTRLVVILRERGLTQQSIARLCGKSGNAVSRWCRGKCQPDSESLAILEAVLGTDGETLLRPVDFNAERRP